MRGTEESTRQGYPCNIPGALHAETVFVCPGLNDREGIRIETEACDLACRSKPFAILAIGRQGDLSSLVRIWKSDPVGVQKVEKVDEGALNEYRPVTYRPSGHEPRHVRVETGKPLRERRFCLHAAHEFRIPHAVTAALISSRTVDNHQLADGALVAA